MAITGDHSPNVAGSVIFLSVLAFVTYALRVYCRLTRRSWSVEDWIMTVALVRRTNPAKPSSDLTPTNKSKVPFCVLVSGCLGGAFNGIGIHAWRLQQPGNERYAAEGQKFFLVFEVGYCAAIIPIKLSISWMLIRIAEGRRMYIYIQYAVITLFTLMNVIALIFILINCIPIQAAWDTSLLEKGGHCQPAHVLTDVYYATTAVNIATDWVTALMCVSILDILDDGRWTNIYTQANPAPLERPAQPQQQSRRHGPNESRHPVRLSSYPSTHSLSIPKPTH
jgi:hypothetical protein